MIHARSSGAANAGFLHTTVVLMPALNEEASVADTVRGWLNLGAAQVRVVDNGSTDGTAAAARNAGAQVFVEPHRGYGAAAWRGLQDWTPGLTWVLFSSADGSDRLAPNEIPSWQSAVDASADLVAGDRVFYASSRAQLNFCQRLGNRITCAAIRIGWSRSFNDMGSLRLVRHAALMSLGLQDRGFGWNVEMQVRALERLWKIVELPVHYHPRTAGQSKISGTIPGTVRAGKGILKMLWLLWRWRRAAAFGISPARALGKAPRPVGGT